MSEEIIESPKLKLAISPRELISKYIRYLPWLVLSVVITLAVAYVKLRYSTPIYRVSGKLLVNSAAKANANEKFDDLLMIQGNEKINDQIELIRSTSMAGRVVRSLGLQKQIYNKGKIRSSIVHPYDAPFNFEIVHITDSTSGFTVLVSLLGNNQFTLNEQPQKYYFNQQVSLPGVTFRILPTAKDWRSFSSNEFVVSWRPVESIAPGLSGSIGVGLVNDFSNVLGLSYETENTRLGRDIINAYMREYQQASLEDKREIAARTIDFIEQQLDTVRYDLSGVERNLQQYREKSRVINPEIQTQQFLTELTQSNKQLAEEGVKLRIIDYLINYLSDKRNQFRIIPAMMGIQEPALLQQVSRFNDLQLQRETALKTIPPGNSVIIGMETTIERLRLDMIENLKNVRQTNLLVLEQLKDKYNETDRLIKTVPAKEKQLLEVTRQQNILQDLYSFLLQKKLETAIASASTISSIKVVEPAVSTGMVRPNSKAMYMIALLLGLAIPVAIIFLREYLNDKVKTKTDIQQLTDAPILGEIGHSDDSGALVVTRNNRKFLAEQFRIVRSNLQYILPKVEKPVLLVTSSFSGEGKSFVSTNLGSVLALSGKRTVILEFDIRKPKIMKGLGLTERKGITNYIIGHIQLSDVIHPVPEVENLFVIPCGPVPPNPAEMLLEEKVTQLFKELKQQFDCVIIDSAPVGLVSDAITLSRHANATVYIVRHNYTLKKQMHLIDELYRHNKLPHLSIIINDINTRTGYGSYYGYGGYGYGYGYGNGGKNSAYFDTTLTKRFGWKRLFGRSAKK